MKILQVGHCCAGIPEILKDFTRGDMLSWKGKPHEIISQYAAFPRNIRAIRDYDLIHFHTRTLLPESLDLPLLRAMGKRAYITYHGDDIRGKGAPALSRLARAFVSTPDILYDGAEWFPNPFPTDEIPCIPPRGDNTTLRVCHAPSDPLVKGTSLIREAVKGMKNVEYREMTGKPHDEVLSLIRWSDVLIDQVRPDHGIYGVVSIEAMGLGRPAISTLNQEFYPRDCPVIPLEQGTQEDIQCVLTSLFDTDHRKRVGMAGRKYVERVHDVKKLCQRFYDT